jgi:hypothetical protein
MKNLIFREQLVGRGLAVLRPSSSETQRSLLQVKQSLHWPAEGRELQLELTVLVSSSVLGYVT